jgi:hypothetical protein
VESQEFVLWVQNSGFTFESQPEESVTSGTEQAQLVKPGWKGKVELVPLSGSNSFYPGISFLSTSASTDCFFTAIK